MKNTIKIVSVVLVMFLALSLIMGLSSSLKGGNGGNTVNSSLSGLSKYNIAYGDEVPSAKTKLWVKCDKPKKIEVSDTLTKTVTNEKIETLDWELDIDNSRTAGALIGTDLYIYTNGISKLDLLTGECTQVSTTTFSITSQNIIAVPYGQYIYFAYEYSVYSGKYVHETHVDKFNTVNNQFIGSWFRTTPTEHSYTHISTSEINGFIYNDMFYINCSFFTGAFDLEECEFNSSVKYPITTLCPSEFMNGYIYFFHNNAVDQVDLTGTEDKKQFNFPYTSNFYFTPKGIGNNFYLFGQAGTLGGNTIQRFNTISGSLDVLDLIMSVSRQKPIVARLGADCYILGGCSTSGNTVIEKFTTEFELEEGTLILLTNGKKKNEMALWKDEEGLDYMTSVSSAYIGNSKGKGESVEVYLYDDELSDWRLIAA